MVKKIIFVILLLLLILCIILQFAGCATADVVAYAESNFGGLEGYIQPLVGYVSSKADFIIDFKVYNYFGQSIAIRPLSNDSFVSTIKIRLTLIKPSSIAPKVVLFNSLNSDFLVFSPVSFTGTVCSYELPYLQILSYGYSSLSFVGDVPYSKFRGVMFSIVDVVDYNEYEFIYSYVDGQHLYDHGYGDGFGDGCSENPAYNAGYDVGFDDGYDTKFEDNSGMSFLRLVLQSVSDTLGVKIFGFFSLLDLLTLFFAISSVLIFIKMFAGGVAYDIGRAL